MARVFDNGNSCHVACFGRSKTKCDDPASGFRRVNQKFAQALNFQGFWVDGRLLKKQEAPTSDGNAVKWGRFTS